jgi:hypothetical protein
VANLSARGLGVISVISFILGLRIIALGISEL